MSDADRRQLEHRTELKRETGAAWVIARRGVDQQHVWELRQRLNRGLQQ